MKEINLTVLGMSGSGKTCFLIAMYHEMCAGINGYTLYVKDSDDDYELRAKWKNLCSVNGAERFPQGTSKNGDYRFSLKYAYQTIKEFHWMDYRGGCLERGNNEDTAEVETLLNRINESTCLFIFVDGDNLVEGDRETVINKVRDNCSNTINQRISEFNDKNQKLPPIAIVLTKFDKITRWKKVELVEILKEAFSPLFLNDGNGNKIAIIPVSIGQDVEDKSYTGNLQPINIYQPLFFGIFDILKSEMKQTKKEKAQLEKEKILMQEHLNEKKKLREDKYGKGHVFRNVLHSKDKEKLEQEIKNEEDKLTELIHRMDEVKEELAKRINYVEKVRHELVGMDVYVKGRHYEMEEGVKYDE